MTLIYFILILGVIVFIHELGHFIFAKKAGIYVYEFSIGMGPKIFSKKRKNDETVYSIRLLPIGGYVSMAGETVEIDTDIPEDKQFQNKKWIHKVLTVTAGVIFNFLLAISLLFIIALINGAPQNKVIVGNVDENYNAYKSGLETGDLVTKINNKKVKDDDMFILYLTINQGKELSLEVTKNDGSKKEIKIEPTKEEENYIYGFNIENKIEKGFFKAVKYAFTKTLSTIKQMLYIVGFLITGKLKLNSLSGPVGIYQVVGEVSKTGIQNILYLIAYISINVGVVNLLPFPAFDGGRLLFLIIEKIINKPLNNKIENIVNNIGFILLMMLMAFVTYNDILKLFTK